MGFVFIIAIIVIAVVLYNKKKNSNAVTPSEPPRTSSNYTPPPRATPTPKPQITQTEVQNKQEPQPSVQKKIEATEDVSNDSTESENEPDFNQLVARLIARIRASSYYRNYTEDFEDWDELLKEREEDVNSFVKLFSLDADLLTEENITARQELQDQFFPSKLCDLAKCYIMKERFSDTITLLEDKQNLGAGGIKTLLGIAYFQRAFKSESQEDVTKAFSILRNTRILSKKVEQEIANERFQGIAQMCLADMYRVDANDLESAHDCLEQIIQTDWDESYKQPPLEELSHYKKGLHGWEYV